MPTTWSNLRPIAKALAQDLSQDTLLQSPFCARTYALGLANCQSTQLLQQAIEATDATLLSLVTGYFRLLVQTTTPDPQLDEKLFVSQCRCESALKSLPKQFHSRNSISGHLLVVSVRLRCGEDGLIGDMASFVEVIADSLDMVIVGIQSLMVSMAKARSLNRKLQDFVMENAKPLAEMMTAWLKRSSSIYVFALFGTLMCLAGSTLFSQLQLLPDFLNAFDDRLHALVKGGHEAQPRNGDAKWLCLDLVFHGAGGFARTFHTFLCSIHQKDMTRAYFLVSAKKCCADVCELLSFSKKAGRSVQDGKVADLCYLAVFAQDLCELTKDPTPPLVSLILSQTMPAQDGALDVHYIFKTMMHIKDICYNSMAHTSSDDSKSSESFTIAFRDYTPKGECLQTCSKCKAVYYCCSDCQHQDWKYGSPPHKRLCASLAKLREMENNRAIGYQGRRDWEAACRNLNLPRGEIVKYIADMLSYFSGTDKMNMDKANLEKKLP